jgi:hypothetical protein
MSMGMKWFRQSEYCCKGGVQFVGILHALFRMEPGKGSIRNYLAQSKLVQRHPRVIKRGNGLRKIQIQLDFFLLDFVGLDYFRCGCPHAKLNWMFNQYWMSKHELLILLSGSGRGSRI